ncbi:oxidoreductase [Paludifilum halophilum]|uniref:Oxidoreductase n=1 Tax=Paludifilum halophilum TaxID=1642702 RepID=A0A235B3H6_9BACL|nr:oxidoreductase [Paludifilum halophilum]OYD06782.1 oxidoreductase [Paludifilum halophilum]
MQKSNREKERIGLNTIKAGIIGYGLSGAVFHAPTIHAAEGLELVKVVTSREEEVRKDWPGVQVVQDPEALFRDPDLDLVVVATPNTLHYPLAEQALKAGKHVVVEKPFVIHADEGIALARLAQEKGRVLSVYHNRRWDNDFLTVKKWIEEGRLGNIHTFQVRFDRFRPQVRDRWREKDLPGAGILYDLGSHLIDQALTLFGDPETVFGDVQAQRPGAETEDYFHIVLGYENGLRAILHAGSMVKQPGPRFEVHGSRGSLVKYGMDSQENSLKQGMKPGDPGWGEDDPECYAEVTLEEGGQTVTETVPTLRGRYEDYYRNLVQSVTRGVPAPVTAEDGVRVIRVIERVKESCANQKTLSL